MIVNIVKITSFILLISGCATLCKKQTGRFCFTANDGLACYIVNHDCKEGN